MVSRQKQQEQPIRTKVTLETSRVPWQDLQRFFAGGMTIKVARELDLVEVACQLAHDNKLQVQQWLSAKKIGNVSDVQAKDWYDNNAIVWAVVVKPWVLVQDENGAN
jgi:hypothetical protein